MSLPVVYLPEALEDIDSAYSYYESRQTGLGDRFLEAVQDQVAKIQSYPASYGFSYQHIRAAPLRRFPYVVYYREETARILIIAVQHGRRDSKGWRSRT